MKSAVYYFISLSFFIFGSSALRAQDTIDIAPSKINSPIWAQDDRGTSILESRIFKIYSKYPDVFYPILSLLPNAVEVGGSLHIPNSFEICACAFPEVSYPMPNNLLWLDKIWVAKRASIHECNFSRGSQISISGETVDIINNKFNNFQFLG